MSSAHEKDREQLDCKMSNCSLAADEGKTQKRVFMARKLLGSLTNTRPGESSSGQRLRICVSYMLKIMREDFHMVLRCRMGLSSKRKCIV
jgi:hypothetical protein